jgi:thioredoxin 1
MIEMQSGELEEMTSTGVVLVDIYGTWCLPCKTMLPIIESIDKKIGDKVKVIKINIDECEEANKLMNVRGIKGIPAFLFFKDGKDMGSLVGRQTEDIILETLQNLLRA